MQKIAFNDLEAQYAHLKEEIDAGIASVIKGCHFISGPQVGELEQALCAYTGRKYCVTVSSGTDALLIPLMAWDIHEGDAVFVPGFTFFATAEVVSLTGATPVFCDINPHTFNLDPDSLKEQVERVLREGTLTPKAVIPVDLFGEPAEFPRIEEICREYHLLLMEDAAQGFGGAIQGKRACCFGDVSATSFFPAKVLGCYGDGGAIFTDDEEMYQKLLSIRVHGKGSDKYENIRLGLNARLDTMQAAILLPKLRALDEEITVRNRMAARYSEQLEGIVEPQAVLDGYFSSFGYYTVQARDGAHRDAIMKELKEQGIPTMIYYPIPLHLQKVYEPLGYQKGDLPVCEALCERVFSLPMHGYLTQEQVDFICDTIKSL